MLSSINHRSFVMFIFWISGIYFLIKYSYRSHLIHNFHELYLFKVNLSRNANLDISHLSITSFALYDVDNGTNISSWNFLNQAPDGSSITKLYKSLTQLLGNSLFQDLAKSNAICNIEAASWSNKSSHSLNLYLLKSNVDISFFP